MAGNVTVDSNDKLYGTVQTWHCNHTLKVVNVTRGTEIERFSSWDDGTIYLGDGGTTTPAAPMGGPANGTIGWAPESRLTAYVGDLIRIVRPGYDNLYTSGKIVTEFTL